MRKNSRTFVAKVTFIVFLLVLMLPLSGGLASFDKRVLLTFDDGPDARYTPQVLDVLKQHQIKGLFFVLGKKVQEEPALFQRMIIEGHTIGNHTFDHVSIDKLTTEELYEQVLQTDRMLQKYGNVVPVYFRPPRGCYTKENDDVLCEQHKITLLWDLGLEKSGMTDPASLTKRLLLRSRNRVELVLLLHDGNVDGNDRTPTVEALPLLIKELKAREYRFIDPGSEEGQKFIERYAAEHKRYQ